MLTDYREIYNGEIFVKSQCIELENSLMDFFQRNLAMMGYSPIDIGKKIWCKHGKTVIICLVDDIETCAPFPAKTANLFDKNTIVITDNKVNCKTEYTVLQLPESFFGIYYYQTEHVDFNPVAPINLSVNRIDPSRLIVLLELLDYYNLNELSVNFNCFMHEKTTDQLTLIDNFVSNWNMIDHEKYHLYFDQIINQIPINTHNKDPEHAMLGSFLNLVIETYCGKNVIALSEKIFRSLVTPVPWYVYGGFGTNTYLKSLGFDILDDVVDHHNCCHPAQVVKQAVINVDRIKSLPIQQLIDRCLHAALHNQKLLSDMRNQWPVDFATWWAAHIHHVK